MDLRTQGMCVPHPTMNAVPSMWMGPGRMKDSYIQGNGETQKAAKIVWDCNRVLSLLNVVYTLENNKRSERCWKSLATHFNNRLDMDRQFKPEDIKMKIKHLLQERKNRHQLRFWEAARMGASVEDLYQRLEGVIEHSEGDPKQWPVKEMSEYLFSIQATKHLPSLLLWSSEVGKLVGDSIMKLHKEFGTRIIRIHQPISTIFPQSEIELYILHNCECTICSKWNLLKANDTRLAWTHKKCKLYATLLVLHQTLPWKFMLAEIQRDTTTYFWLEGWPEHEIKQLMEILHSTSNCEFCQPGKRRNRGVKAEKGVSLEEMINVIVSSKLQKKPKRAKINEVGSFQITQPSQVVSNPVERNIWLRPESITAATNTRRSFFGGGNQPATEALKNMAVQLLNDKNVTDGFRHFGKF